MDDQKARITINEVARLSGVAKSTVSRVLNNSGFVSAKTRKKVMEVVEQYHYVPNSMARELGTPFTRSIGIFLNDLQNPYFSELLSGAEEVVSARKYFPFICIASNEEREAFYVEEMLKRRVGGVIFLSALIHDRELIGRLIKNTRALSVQSDVPGIPQIDCTNYEGTYDVMQYLLSLGHKKIAYINSYGKSRVLHQRFEAYRDSLLNHKIPLEKDYIRSIPKNGSGYECAEALMALPSPPSAIHCCNDFIAAGVYRYLTEKEFKIPGDVSLSGFDDLPHATIMRPTLTTVFQPMKEMGRRAAEMLIDLLEGREEEKEDRVFSTSLLIRESTAPPSR